MLFEIRDEKDLHRAIESVWAGHTEVPRGRPARRSYTPEIPIDEIGFVGWPRLDITVCGDNFTGGIPARVMPALYKYQLMLDRVYARAIGADARGLTLPERRRIELIVGLAPGSTSIGSDFSSVLNSILELMKFVPELSAGQAALGVLVAGLAMAPGVVKAHMREKTERLRMDHEARMGEQQHELIRLVAEISRGPNELRAPLDDAAKAHNALLGCLDDSDQLYVDGEHILSGRDVRRSPRKRRRAPLRERFEAEYRVLSVEAPRSRRGVRAEVREVETDVELTVDIDPDILSDDTMSDLLRAKLDGKPLPMEVDVFARGEQIVRATLVSIGSSED